MPQTSVVRPISEAPRIGEEYKFEHGGKQFHGVVVAHRSLRKAKAHVHVVIELSEAQHRRLIIGE